MAEVLDRLRVPGFLRLHPGVEEALDAAFARPPYLRDELLLALTLSAPAAARAFVRDILDYWQPALPDTTLVDRAILMASELVTNAVVHAGPTCGCGWSCAATGCTSQRGTAAPGCCGWSPPATRRPRVGAAWGWWSSSAAPGGQPHPHGGKVVWCTLKPGSPCTRIRAACN